MTSPAADVTEFSLLNLEPTVGFEPTTNGLQNRHSTPELSRRISILLLYERSKLDNGGVATIYLHFT